jgi:hypothetical protein
VAALAPSAQEKLLEFIDARRSSVRCRPFRVPTGAHETPDGLSLDIQCETDCLLTHAFAVQSYYFVVTVNPALVGAVGIDTAPITADDFRARVQLEPSSQAIGGAVRQ